MFRLVVVFSIERLVAVYFPMKLTAIFTPRIKKMSIVMVFVVGLALYFFNFVHILELLHMLYQNP